MKSIGRGDGEGRNCDKKVTPPLVEVWVNIANTDKDGVTYSQYIVKALFGLKSFFAGMSNTIPVSYALAAPFELPEVNTFLIVKYSKTEIAAEVPNLPPTPARILCPK